MNCTTVVDVDNNGDPTNIAIYRVTFDPCATPHTVRYENINVIGTPMVVVDNTTSESISQVFDGDKTVNLVVIQIEGLGVTFGVSKKSPIHSTFMQQIAHRPQSQLSSKIHDHCSPTQTSH